MTDKKMRGNPIRDESVPEPAEQEALRGADSPVSPSEASAGRPETGANVVSELQDKYLRLAADFDNFRRRTVKERTELWAKAQADLVSKLVDALDDLARFAGIDPMETDPRTIHQGVDMVERKLWKQLDAAGVKRIDAVGVPFDPAIHEAVTTTAAPAPEQDRTVGSILQPGYRLGDLLIRPARVIVQLWADGAGQSS